ncbi:hypothetical protein WOSG25_050110 [Weissella oryzae SG25]|uniref:Uncharacterized protein n=1 Tax=Weissella oryzae (strain DSM 25784 / JCM 18191 / LMG 30913 / SG25) TaxID=1329250 RepID=A0A069CTF4_WEIOS|nr:hypothetical protein [Weissella oryzae]GAK30739.1 hypothetical protein WOSG25_050110 [Weissella oryzae SG25]
MAKRAKAKGNIFSDFGVKEWSIFGIVLLLFCGYQFAQYNKTLKSKTTVQLSQVQQAIADKKTVVFYRDNCPECQKDFKGFYLRYQFKKDILFVNMHNKGNRYLIKEYNLTSVPTLINHNGTFTGLTSDQYMEEIKKGALN